MELAPIIAIIPLVVAAVITVFAKQLGEPKAGWLGTLGMGSGVLLSLGVVGEVIGQGEHFEPWRSYLFREYFTFGSVKLPLGVQVDGLTAWMLVVVTVVAFAVNLYSIGYMHGDKRYTRYFAVVNLFTGGMLGLVLADNYFLALISWEIMGLCSYALISHWYEEEGPQWAGIKAFMTTRVGDIGLMVGIWYLFYLTGSLEFEAIAAKLKQANLAGSTPLLVAAFLVFTGGIGKSAQFPLHTWLPDAMAGPTPASSLIHAATMVAAGVYLVARSYSIFLLSPESLAIVALFGAFTAIFAASIGTLMTDIKKVLAYSTVSQLGYMMMGLGVGGWSAGGWHLTTHAFFKALLFQASGAVIHAVHTQEVHQMGGLRKKLPITFITWMVGFLALAGFPFTSGWYSKDALLIAAYEWQTPASWAAAGWGWLGTGHGGVVFWVGVITAFLTAYYMTRVTWLTFFGHPRDHHAYAHAHESPWTMTAPLVILAVPALLLGVVDAATGIFTGVVVRHDLPHLPHPALVVWLATGAGLGGILVGWLVYGYAGSAFRQRMITALRPAYTLIKGKYFVDEVYSALFVRGTLGLADFIYALDKYVVDWLVNAVGALGDWWARWTGALDHGVVDGAVNGAADLSVGLGRGLRRLSTGHVQQYMLTMVLIVLVGVILFQSNLIR